MPLKLSTSDIGKQAEKRACRFLEKQGLSLVEANYRCKLGEIDLVMQDKESLVFVEVRFRKRSKQGHGVETLSYTKKQRIIKSALCYLQENHCVDKIACRFDVLGSDAAQEIIWLKNAFEVEY